MSEASGMDQGEITELLLAWRQGDAAALDGLTAVVYPELRRLAHRYMRGERDGHSLQTTALVHEAFLRLVDSRLVQWQDRAHFFAVSAQLMRRILVDSARARGAAKRGSGVKPVVADDALAVFESRGRDLVALDEALDRLAEVDPEKAKLIELRFFGGLSMAEAAEALGLNEHAARWNWRMAKAWLSRELAAAGFDGH